MANFTRHGHANVFDARVYTVTEITKSTLASVRAVVVDTDCIAVTVV